MDELFSNSRKVIGVKQSLRAIEKDLAACVYIARDAQERVIAPVRAVCTEKSVPMRDAESMVALGAACGIAVGAAVVAVLNDAPAAGA